MKISPREIARINDYRKLFYDHSLRLEDYSKILNEEVFSNERFLKNIEETADNLNVDKDVVYEVITHMILFIASYLIKFHIKRLRINLIGFVYFDCLNPIFNPKSKQHYKKQF